jgi:hypothetical protein
MFQKSVIKCQNTFERIREAYADLFGFHYRPSAATSVYAYKAELEKEDNEDKEDKKDNKSRKAIRASTNNKTLKKR